EHGKLLQPMRNGRVPVEPIEQHPHAAVPGSAIESPVQIEIRGDKRLVEMPQGTIHLSEGAEQVAPDVVGVDPSLSHDGLDEGALVDLFQVGGGKSGED